MDLEINPNENYVSKLFTVENDQFEMVYYFWSTFQLNVYKRCGQNSHKTIIAYIIVPYIHLNVKNIEIIH